MKREFEFPHERCDRVEKENMELRALCDELAKKSQNLIYEIGQDSSLYGHTEINDACWEVDDILAKYNAFKERENG